MNATEPAVAALPAHIGFCLRPKPGEQVCGDQCGVWFQSDGVLLALADGLGHGPDAERAASAALALAGELKAHPLAHIFAACDERLRSSRGTALALARVQPRRQLLEFASVGNLRAVLRHGQRERRLGAARGIVGAGYTGLTPELFPLASGDSLFLYSDGLDELLPLAELLPAQAGAAELSRQALQRWAKPGDDASMLVYLNP